VSTIAALVTFDATSLVQRTVHNAVTVDVPQRPNRLPKKRLEDGHRLRQLEHLLQRWVVLVWLRDLDDAVLVDHGRGRLVQRAGERERTRHRAGGSGVKGGLHLRE
jgi:hypothetical protein